MIEQGNGGAGNTAPLLNEKPKEVAVKPDLYLGKPITLGSKIAVIKQVDKFNILPKVPQAQYIRDSIVRKISSEWKKGTRDIIRGLTPQEEELYLPRIIGMSSDSTDWNTQTMEYWADFFVLVPTDKELPLEIGFQKDTNNKVVPINIEDYMKYNFAKQSSRVAHTEEQLINKSVYDFYIEDLSAIKEKEKIDYEKAKKADIEFLRLFANSDKPEVVKANQSKVNLLVIMLTNVLNPYSMESLDKEILLKKVKDENPVRFLSVLQDKFLETKALLQEAVSTGVINIEGNSYWYADQILGSTEQEAIAYFETPDGQALKGKLQEKIKAYRV